MSKAKIIDTSKMFKLDKHAYAYYDYIIFDTGMIWWMKHDREVKPFQTRTYYAINVSEGFGNDSKNRVTKRYGIHRLVAYAFLENDDPEHKTEVNHLDFNKSNNAKWNLEWCTPSSNQIHSRKFKPFINYPHFTIRCKYKGVVYSSVRDMVKFGCDWSPLNKSNYRKCIENGDVIILTEDEYNEMKSKKDN